MGQLWIGTTRFLIRSNSNTTTTTTANTTTTGNDTITTTTANTNTTTTGRKGSELGLALRGGDRLLGHGAAVRHSGSALRGGGRLLGLGVALHSSGRGFSEASVVDGANWANGAVAMKQDAVIPYFPRRYTSTEASAPNVIFAAANAAERDLRVQSAKILIPEFKLDAFYMTGLACSMPAFPSRSWVRIHRDEPGIMQPWTHEPTGLWGGVRLTHPF